MEEPLGVLGEEVALFSFRTLEVKQEGLLSQTLSLVLLVLEIDVLDLLVFPVDFLDGNNVVVLFHNEELRVEDQEIDDVLFGRNHFFRLQQMSLELDILQLVLSILGVKDDKLAQLLDFILLQQEDFFDSLAFFGHLEFPISPSVEVLDMFLVVRNGGIFEEENHDGLLAPHEAPQFGLFHFVKSFELLFKLVELSAVHLEVGGADCDVFLVEGVAEGEEFLVLDGDFGAREVGHSHFVDLGAQLERPLRGVGLNFIDSNLAFSLSFQQNSCVLLVGTEIQFLSGFELGLELDSDRRLDHLGLENRTLVEGEIV